MNSRIRCLIVSSQEQSFLALESVLAALPVTTQRARNCAEAGKLLSGPSPAQLVITDALLADGNWLAVLAFAENAKEKVNVVVVSPRADVELYVDAMNRGAFDYITETFSIPELIHVVRTAIEGACQARGNPAQALSVARQGKPRPLVVHHAAEPDSSV